MNKTLFCLFILISFICCNLNKPKDSYKLSKKEILSDEILKKAAIELMAKTGLQPCGTGAQMLDQIKMLALSFYYKKPLQIHEARALLIKSVDVLVDAVNADERIRPYLNNYPFTPKNVEIRIFLRRHDSFDVPPGELSAVSAITGIFEYEIDNPQTKLFTTILSETYEEAKKKIK